MAAARVVYQGSGRWGDHIVVEYRPMRVLARVQGATYEVSTPFLYAATVGASYLGLACRPGPIADDPTPDADVLYEFGWPHISGAGNVCMGNIARHAHDEYLREYLQGCAYDYLAMQRVHPGPEVLRDYNLQLVNAYLTTEYKYWGQQPSWGGAKRLRPARTYGYRRDGFQGGTPLDIMKYMQYLESLDQSQMLAVAGSGRPVAQAFPEWIGALQL